MKKGDKIIVKWKYVSSMNVDMNVDINVSDIGKISCVNEFSFNVLFDHRSDYQIPQFFHMNNDLNPGMKYIKYNYRQEKLERILK